MKIQGEDETGRLKGKHTGTGIVRPNFWERARYYNMERELADALDKVNQCHRLRPARDAVGGGRCLPSRRG